MGLHGVLPVIQLPYLENDQIDAETLHHEIDWLFESGVDGIVLAMVTEVVRLTEAERDKLVELAVRFTNGRGPVIASVGAESKAQAVRHTKAAVDFGADALMATPPTTTRCDAAQIASYYEGILAACDGPLIVQDASGYLGNAIPIAAQADLFNRYPSRVLFKPEAPPFGPNLSALHTATGKKAKVFEGAGGVALVDSYHRGITGTMPGADLIRAILVLWQALESGDQECLDAVFPLLVSIVSMPINLDAFLAIEKHLLVRQGVFKNTVVRGPVGYVMDAETTRQVDWLFDRLMERVIDQECRLSRQRSAKVPSIDLVSLGTPGRC
jgi:dihydrodipicolinate synthase/N-acetylneuraminate lyase